MTPSPDDPLFRALIQNYERAGIRSVPVETPNESLILSLLERLNDEPGCEFEHVETTCSTHVTHRLTSCRRSALLCDSATIRQTTLMTSGIRCRACLEPAANCWKVNPA